MTLNEYQRWTNSTAIYRDPMYPVLGLAEETGEFLGKLAKYVRDDTALDKLRYDLTREAGDIMWMLARVLEDYGISLQSVIDTNVEKLERRKEKGTIHGSGDAR